MNRSTFSSLLFNQLDKANLGGENYCAWSHRSLNALQRVVNRQEFYVPCRCELTGSVPQPFYVRGGHGVHRTHGDFPFLPRLQTNHLNSVKFCWQWRSLQPVLRCPHYPCPHKFYQLKLFSCWSKKKPHLQTFHCIHAVLRFGAVLEISPLFNNTLKPS